MLVVTGCALRIFCSSHIPRTKADIKSSKDIRETGRSLSYSNEIGVQLSAACDLQLRNTVCDSDPSVKLAHTSDLQSAACDFQQFRAGSETQDLQDSDLSVKLAHPSDRQSAACDFKPFRAGSETQDPQGAACNFQPEKAIVYDQDTHINGTTVLRIGKNANIELLNTTPIGTNSPKR